MTEGDRAATEAPDLMEALTVSVLKAKVERLGQQLHEAREALPDTRARHMTPCMHCAAIAEQDLDIDHYGPCVPAQRTVYYGEWEPVAAAVPVQPEPQEKA